MKAELFRGKICRFLPNERGDPLFYSVYLRKIRLCMTYSNLKNSSLCSFEIFRLIHHYSQILGVSLELCIRSICLLFQTSFILTAILRRSTVTLFIYHKNNAYISLLVNYFVEIMGISGTRIGFLILLSKDSKLLIYYSPVA